MGSVGTAEVCHAEGHTDTVKPSLNGHPYKTDTSVKWTPKVSPCLSLLLLVDSLQDRNLSKGRFRRYDSCLRVSYGTSMSHEFTTNHVVWIRTTTFTWHIVDFVSENYARVDGRKSWRMLVEHESLNQNSHRLKDIVPVPTVSILDRVVLRSSQSP